MDTSTRGTWTKFSCHVYYILPLKHVTVAVTMGPLIPTVVSTIFVNNVVGNYKFYE